MLVWQVDRRFDWIRLTSNNSLQLHMRNTQINTRHSNPPKPSNPHAPHCGNWSNLQFHLWNKSLFMKWNFIRRPSIISSQSGGGIAGVQVRPFIMLATTQCKKRPRDGVCKCDGKQTFNGSRQLPWLLCWWSVIGYSELSRREALRGGESSSAGPDGTRGGGVPVMASHGSVGGPSTTKNNACCLSSHETVVSGIIHEQRVYNGARTDLSRRWGSQVVLFTWQL